MKKIIPYISVVTAMLIWAGAGIAVKEALQVFTPLTLIVLRFTLAVVLMFFVGIIFRRNEVLGLQCVEKKDLPLFMLGGLFQPFLYFIFETYTYQSFFSPTVAEALLSTQPVMAPLFAWVLLREKVTKNNIVGIVISTLGVLILLLMGNTQLSVGGEQASIWKGLLLAMLTVSMSVSYSVVLRKIPTRYSALSIVFYVQSFSLLLFYPLWFLMDGGIINNGTVDGMGNGLLAVGYLAVLASVAAFVLFCYTVRHIGVTRANVFNNVRPVFTAILMWLIFGEVLPMCKWIGILIIIFGLFISQKHEKT